MAKFKPWDIVERIRDSTWMCKIGHRYTVHQVDETRWMISLVEDPLGNKVWMESYFILSNSSVEDKELITNNQIMTNYYHTAVLINKATTSLQIEYEELIPYKVMIASDEQNMRDILVRELPKEVDSKDCLFKISRVFN